MAKEVLGNTSQNVPNIPFSYEAIRKATTRLKKSSTDDHVSSFLQIPSYFDRLKTADPTGRYELCRKGNRIIQSFLAPSGIRAVFQLARPYIGVDAAFGKTRLEHHLYAAAAYDSNGHPVILAWGHGEAESVNSWKWFLYNLRQAYPRLNTHGMVIMSDRQKGLDTALGDIFPLAHHGNCSLHIAKNVEHHHGLNARGAFASLLFAKDKDAFDTIMADLQSKHPAAAAYIEKIEHSRWAIYAFPFRRYGFTTSNVIEQCNSWLLPLRTEPIVQLLSGIYDKMMESIVERSITAHQTNGQLVPSMLPILRDLQAKASSYKIIISKHDEESSVAKVVPKARRIDGEDHHEATIEWKVLSPQGHRRAVCSCSLPAEHGYPCKHIVAFLWHLDQRFHQGSSKITPIPFVSIDFYVVNWQLQYKQTLASMPPVAADRLEEDPLVIPPRIKIAPGQTKKKRGIAGTAPTKASQRYMDVDASPAPNQPGRGIAKGRGTQRCRKCGNAGHNRATCQQDEQDVFQWIVGLND